MTRNEKEEKVRKQDGKVFEIFNVEIHTTYLNPHYTLSQKTANEIAPTGRLNIFELNPSERGPSFSGRWDGGSRDEGRKERCDLDIDIYGVLEEERIRFINDRGGYSGHHTKEVPSDTGHAYRVSLRTPSEVIFEGTICFNLHRKMGFEASLGFAPNFGTK